MKHHAKWAALILIPLALGAEANTSICKARFQALPKIQDHCSDLDMGITLEGNPFVYSNPDGACDLGLTMPGLPTFARSGTTSCGILQSITSQLVGEINESFRDSVNESLDSLPDYITPLAP